MSNNQQNSYASPQSLPAGTMATIAWHRIGAVVCWLLTALVLLWLALIVLELQGRMFTPFGMPPLMILTLLGVGFTLLGAGLWRWSQRLMFYGIAAITPPVFVFGIAMALRFS